MENQPAVQTSVQQVDVDLNEIFGAAPGADSIITPTGDPNKAKPSIFTTKTADMSFLDKEDEEEVEDDPEKKVEKTDTSKGAVSRETSTEFLDEIDENQEGEQKKGGRPKTDKNALVGFLKKRIESKEMFAFDDYDESKQTLDEYLGSLSEKDIDELWQANVDNMKQEVAAKTPQEFFDSLPQELQYAAKYVADGGQDIKGLFKALAQVEEVRELDPTKDNDQEVIIRNYLQATKFGTAEEIEEELTTWKDLGVLEKKAKQFKPKLDQMQEEIVQNQLAEQEARKEQQKQAAQAYQQNVFEALRPAEINGLKLDKKTQAQLYSGLTQPNYPSISGRQTNLLGHLLEKYQFVEPNYSLIAEALWLLSDPEGYRGQLQKQGGNQKIEQTVRLLKTEQSRKTAASQQDDDEPSSRKIARPTNIFKR